MPNTNLGKVAVSWRRHIIAAAILTSVAALLLFFAAPERDSLLFSAAFPSRTSDGPYSSSEDPLLAPISTEKYSNSSSTSLVPPSTAPAPSPSENFDDTVEESSSRDLKLPPFITEPNSISPAPFVPVLQEAVSNSSPIGNPGASEVESASADKKIPPLLSEMPIWSSPVDQELMYAKREIESAPAVFGDPDLHAPLFRNVSVFKRSYELMERILKVYIYKEGERPIFHTPELKGIYASEGWFMKLMERSKKFVAKDPGKAHLFYLPYSSRQLEYALYVPDSHTIIPLSIFLKNYVNMLSAKYPFWNRTKGADHFFVACHDWGPYTTKLHDELRKKTIKALCNADISEGVFIRGKDVSLPETFIRIPKKPLRDIGGKPASRRSILAFFAGQMHGRVRPILLQYWSGKDEDMRIYGRLPKHVAGKLTYIQHMKSSKFCVCPMGYEVNSPRIVEAIYYECVPVIIADNFVLPFDDVLNWGAFSVVVLEKDIPKLKEILLGISPGQYVTMQMNVKRLQRHFLWHAKPEKYDIFHMILHNIWFNRLNQIQVQQ
ncbi:probable glycosyltransferase At5g03795 [Typha angustifolia]|uniref:probable glycosyltransferase At5g03795 n=1 Tax=Typha angustifolia TaxID=59011 RepID=UPI003C2F81B1